MQSTEVVSHHFSSFVLSRRAVDPQVHVRALHLRSDNVYFLLAGLRMKRLIRCSQDKLCQMRLQFLLGGRNTEAPLHNYNVRHFTAAPCSCARESSVQGVAVRWKSLILRSRLLPSRSFCTWTRFGLIAFLSMRGAHDLGSGSSSSDVEAEARLASLALVGPGNWVVGMARPAREHLKI